MYILPLTSSIATDTLIASAIRILPPRAIILLEDIDAWAEQHAPRRLDEDEDDAEREDVSDRRGSQGDRRHRRNSAGHPERAVTGNSGAFGTKASETPASATEEVPAALSELVVAVTDAENAPAKAISEGPGRDTPGEQYDDSHGDRRRYREPDGGERRDRDRDRSRRDSAVSLSCVLNILDGVEAIDGKIIICTTNALHSLDPTLIRPGRIDLFLEFRRATRLVAERLFHSFYQPSGAGVGGDSAGAVKEGNHAFSALEKEEDEGAVASDLARQTQAWASFIDDEEFSLAELQGEDKAARFFGRAGAHELRLQACYSTTRRAHSQPSRRWGSGLHRRDGLAHRGARDGTGATGQTASGGDEGSRGNTDQVKRRDCNADGLRFSLDLFSAAVSSV